MILATDFNNLLHTVVNVVQLFNTDVTVKNSKEYETRYNPTSQKDLGKKEIRGPLFAAS